MPRLANSLRCTFSAAKTSRLAFLLTDHFGRILVFPDAEKHRLTEPIVSRPFRKFDLTNIDGLTQIQRLISAAVNPRIQSATDCGQVVEWADFNRDLVKFKR